MRLAFSLSPGDQEADCLCCSKYWLLVILAKAGMNQSGSAMQLIWKNPQNLLRTCRAWLCEAMSQRDQQFQSGFTAFVSADSSKCLL